MIELELISILECSARNLMILQDAGKVLKGERIVVYDPDLPVRKCIW